ncbi:pro-resilin-like isoform X2 [Drosophila miranda]|uniref:pro-resilin-like isoform X2 n=1 Tax=Drosophila miranda TaxID=7229 RepID=UPI00143F735F|nr:pro-resilin-like isoform X2 [Drosophila miranda]
MHSKHWHTSAPPNDTRNSGLQCPWSCARQILWMKVQKDRSMLQQYASKYAFGYRIRDFHTGNDFGHKQNRDYHGVTRGQYHILLPDGRIQNVIYHADDTGFHADVSFEGGTKH